MTQLQNDDLPVIASVAIDLDEFAAEQLGAIEILARLSNQHLAIGDAAGFRYSLRCLCARTRALAGAVNDVDKRRAENA